MTAIRNGVPWYDTDGEVVNAHGVGVVAHDGRFYLFGEFKTDDRNVFAGFSCYSSTELAGWTFEGLALPPQVDGLLGPDRVGERPKVLRSPVTGEFVLYAHADDLAYADPHIIVATSASVTGPYVIVGPLMFEGRALRRWDMGTFEDDDGTAYLLTHEGDIFRLSDDRLTIDEQVAAAVAPGGESPAMFRSGGAYWLLVSNKTSWERNDNLVLSAPSPSGPWTPRGLLAPEGTLTHNSQCSFVLRLADGRHIYLGDRWSFPRQASAATQVWLPLNVDGGVAALPEYLEAWTIDREETFRPVRTRTDVGFRASREGEHVEVAFTGDGVEVVGRSAPDCSYGLIEVLRDAPRDDVPPGEVIVLSQIVDWYSLVPQRGTRWVSPPLPAGDYRIRISATGERPEWRKKDGTRFGPTGSLVDVETIVTR